MGTDNITATDMPTAEDYETLAYLALGSAATVDLNPHGGQLWADVAELDRQGHHARRARLLIAKDGAKEGKPVHELGLLLGDFAWGECQGHRMKDQVAWERRFQNALHAFTEATRPVPTGEGGPADDDTSGKAAGNG